jgi:hypothetical protein
MVADSAGLLNAFRGVLLLAALCSWIGYFYWALRMVRERKKGVRLFDYRLALNPFNLVFRPSLLTDAGLRARRWMLINFLGFFLALIGLVISTR